ncbi:coatomer complex protein [Vararia minispora EC-137]|uniref:Coatomer complex protein n=1 Tax=Vararia minispora EC-137 TaxID=1314806 RepID=A0ACB8QIH0_9AGAM|nr:coatomer complex protein [Vararia minispora EC-137]
MESSTLYHAKQQFYLGAYKALADLPLPDAGSDDYVPILVYQARAHIALEDNDAISSLVPPDTENLALKAVTALARYVSASDADAALEELRDLCVEIEGEDVEATEREKGWVRVIAGTAFVRAGEIEEAMETLGAESSLQNLEVVAVLVQAYLSIHRPDLARKEFDRAKAWAEDEILLQLIEASIGLVTGKDSYADAQAFFTEQLGNPSLTSPHLLTSRGVTRLLRGDVIEARSDFEEAISQRGHEDAETLAATVVAAGLVPKRADVEEVWSRFASTYSQNPLVRDVRARSEQFDELAAKYTVPPLAIPASA